MRPEDEWTFFVGPRRSGKSTELINWVKKGERSAKYPYWTRVIVTTSEEQARYLRGDPELEYNQVFSAQDWSEARGINPDCEFMVDEFMFVRNLLDIIYKNGKFAGGSLTGNAVPLERIVFA